MTQAAPTSGKRGLPPGSLVHVGRQHMAAPRLTILAYGPEGLEETDGAGVPGLEDLRRRHPVVWVDLDGLHDVDLVAGLGRVFGVHPLVLEDVVQTGQRLKVEEYGDYVYVVVRMSRAKPDPEGQTEQLSLVLGQGWLLTFQEREGDVLDPVRQRLRNGSRLRSAGADYLAYAVLDAVVDAWGEVVEGLEERLEDLDEESLPDREVFEALHDVRRTLAILRRATLPLRDVLAALQRVGPPLVQEGTQPFLRDVWDHALRVGEAVDTLRDRAGALQDHHLALAGHRMNEVMKVLTIIATLFIPLTFIVGIYGMNFQHMPELGWRWGYPAVLLLMAGLVAGMLAWFRRRGWL